MKKISIFVVAAIVISSCSALKDITNSLSSLQKLQFKLNNVTGMTLAGVDVTKVSDPKRLSLTDGLALGQAFARKSLPAAFTVNVDAKNPNTGASGTKSTTVTLKDLDWRLLIDDKQTINGNLGRTLDIPGNGQTATIPLNMALDLYTFFGDRGYDGLVNLALAIGGAQGSAARVKLDAMPTVTTPIGNMAYPGRITIIDSKFTGS